MNMNQFRPYTAITLAVMFVALLMTGLLLFVAPHGPGSSRWSFMGLSKHQYKDIHLYLAFASVALVTFHGILNKKALAKYIANRNGKYGSPIWLGLVAVVALAVAAVAL